MFSQGLMWESILRDDLRALGLKFELPVIFIQGAEDRLTVTALAKQYFDSISAPSKQFVVLANVGHLAIFTDPDAFLNALTRYARPLAPTK
jgi:pimeloyl-ACP methyl ester carboxylesterase